VFFLCLSELQTLLAAASFMQPFLLLVLRNSNYLKLLCSLSGANFCCLSFCNCLIRSTFIILMQISNAFNYFCLCSSLRRFQLLYFAISISSFDANLNRSLLLLLILFSPTISALLYVTISIALFNANLKHFLLLLLMLFSLMIATALLRNSYSIV